MRNIRWQRREGGAICSVRMPSVMVPLMGGEAVRFVNRCGDITAECVRLAMQLLSVTVQRGIRNAETYRRRGLVISSEQRLVLQCQCWGHAEAWIWGVVNGCVGYAVRLCVWESSKGWLVVREIVFECMLMRSRSFHAAASPYHPFLTTHQASLGGLFQPMALPEASAPPLGPSSHYDQHLQPSPASWSPAL